MPGNDSERDTIIQAVRSYIAKERISREEFASRAKLGKSTVDKLVVGIFSDKTILQIESQLGLVLRGSVQPEFANEEFGKYTREDTRTYPGEYVFARPSFQEPGVIHAFHMSIGWDPMEKALVVREAAKQTDVPAQFGKIYIPRSSMHIFILSNDRAWLKSVILSQLDIYKRMKGMMLTMGNAFANVYSPIAMPVILNKYETIKPAMVGKILPESSFYDEYKKDLQAVEKGQYAKWVHID